MSWVRKTAGSIKESDTPHYEPEPAQLHVLDSPERVEITGVDITVIALWLGHEDTATTHLYTKADLAMKTAALDRLEAPTSKSKRFKPPDDLLAFLEQL